MSTTALRRAGVGGLLAAALFLTSTVINLLAPVQNPYVSTTDYVHQGLLVLAFEGAFAAVLGVTGLIRRQGRLGGLAVVGAVLAGGGYVGVSLLSANNIVQGELSLIPVRLGAALVLLVGSALLGILVLITRTLPWWCGVLLIVAFPLGDVVEGVVRGGEGVLLAALWGTVGAAILTRATAGQRSGLHVAQPKSVVS